MIYTSAHYSTAVPEKLVHGSGHLPPDQHFIEITIPDDLSYKVVEAPASARMGRSFLCSNAGVCGETDACSYGKVTARGERCLSDSIGFSG